MHEWFRDLVRGYMEEKGTSEEEILAAMEPEARECFQQVMTLENTDQVGLQPGVLISLRELWGLSEEQNRELGYAFLFGDRESYYAGRGSKSA